MTKLTRYLQKIFAVNSNQIGVFGSGINKETSTNLEVLQSQDYEGGWSQAIVTNKNYPIWQEMDGVQYGFSYQLAYLMQNGIPEWLSTETYYQNSYCRVGSIIYYSLQDNNIGHNPTLDDGYWSPLLTSNRSIGEIIPSCIPLTEAGLHLLDGALISNGIYADFINYIGGLSATYPDLFTTEALWQQAITTYGSCGKFVYDSVNNTVRLPKVSDILQGTTDVTALGDLVQAGLPQHTHSGTTAGAGAHAHATYGSSSNDDGGGIFTSGNSTTHGDLATRPVGDHTHAFTTGNASNAIYGNSSTVQPQTIKVLYYIVVATSTKTEIEVDIDEIATDLNGKADTDLSNTSPSQTFKNSICDWVMPDYANFITGTASSGTWTQCLKDSFVLVWGTDPYTEDYWCYVSPNNDGTAVLPVGRRYDDYNGSTQSISFTFLVPKNWYFICQAEYGCGYYIYPLKGGN